MAVCGRKSPSCREAGEDEEAEGDIWATLKAQGGATGSEVPVAGVVGGASNATLVMARLGGRGGPGRGRFEVNRLAGNGFGGNRRGAMQ